VTTPEEGMAAIESRFGSHPRHRALHAKGVICKASFTANAEAGELTRAGHMNGQPVDVTARLSNGAGDPTIPDYEPDVRGLATAFHLADGTRTDLLAQTLPRFPFPDERGFFAAMALSKQNLGALLKLPGFAVRYPGALAAIPEANKVLGRCASFASRRYYPFHAYRWLDDQGGHRYVRYAWLQTIDEPDIGKAEAKRRGRDYLFEDLEKRLEQAPVSFDLAIQIADESDDVNDPSAEWPKDERRRLVVGRLEITEIDKDADDSIIFDPMKLVDGIEASGDPVLAYRPDVYSLSYARRTAQ
jgi:catalase